MKAQQKYPTTSCWFTLVATSIFWLVGSQGVRAETIEMLQTDWAKASYELAGKARIASLEALVERARAGTAEQPENAALHIWHGIIASSLAGEDGGLSALGLAREARQAFTRAIELDPEALEGAAYTSMGALYHKVPGWPIGFGSDKKARNYLQLGVQHNPNGIDANYFLGEFMLDEGEPELAKRYLEQALSASPRAGRPLADSGRKAEIQSLLARLPAR